MDKLEFENIDFGEDEDQVDDAGESVAIKLSNKIIKTLDGKVRDHNQNHDDKRVTLSQLKKVYRRGAGVEEEDKGLWALARVNMFLRMKMGDNIAIANKGKPVRVNTYIDISDSWSPSEKDFILAKEEIEEHGLSNFNSVDELYLEDYIKLDSWISY